MHLAELGTRGGPRPLGGVEVSFPVLGDQARGADEVSCVVQFATVPLHKRETDEESIPLRRGIQHDLQHRLRVVCCRLRILLHLAACEAPELRQHAQFGASLRRIGHLPRSHPLSALPRVHATQLHHRDLHRLRARVWQHLRSGAVHRGARQVVQALAHGAIELGPPLRDQVVGPRALLELRLEWSDLPDDHVVVLLGSGYAVAHRIHNLRATSPRPEETHRVRVAHAVRSHVPDTVLHRPQGYVHPHLVRAPAVQGVEKDLRTHEAHHAGSFRHDAVGAQKEAQPTQLGVEHLEGLLAWLKQGVFVIPQHMFLVHALDLSVWSNEHLGDVRGVRRLPLDVHADAGPDAQFLGRSLAAHDVVAVQSLGHLVCFLLAGLPVHEVLPVAVRVLGCHDQIRTRFLCPPHPTNSCLQIVGHIHA
mmetsp:Transcript_102856/g.329970  ORF Transcript_102856/g.329970 Transcript_102856/m.329970 type:complete len:420 (-) Transcript_102856:703-1962(-)